MKEFFKKYNHGLFALYLLLYLPWFIYLEKTVTTEFHVIHSPLDDIIPFCEWFIIPYYIWFLYVASACVYFFLKSRQEFIKMAIYLCVGMTIFLIICTVFPNGLHLRPVEFTRDNILIDLVKGLYLTDTPTNVFPSIHVYNSIAVQIAVSKSNCFKHKKLANGISLVICISICLSTMFLKQHSVIDVCGACVLAFVMYQLVYTPFLSKLKTKIKEKENEKKNLSNEII